jgi:hypothetical protein
MKYRINKYTEWFSEFDIITEDGGVVSVCSDLGTTTSTYYQDRVQSNMLPGYVWGVLGEGKAYIKEWDYESTYEEIIQDALSWLVMGHTEWERDDTIWSDVFPHAK